MGKNVTSTLTGVVLTCNGERLLENCLASLAFCDSILVIDSGSVDQTPVIAARHHAVFVPHAWEGFARQFTYAHSLVASDWLFILDQDEICPPNLGGLIRESIGQSTAALNHKRPAPVGYSVGRKSWYFDRFLRHSGWYPDRIPRVFLRDHVEFYQDAHVHYRVLGQLGHIGDAQAELIHYPYSSFYHQVLKINNYAQQGAEHLREAKRGGGVFLGIAHGLARFMRLYLLKLGFLDGKAGFLVAAHGAFYAFSKYIRVLDTSWGQPYDHQ